MPRNNEISNTDDIIDSRDVIARIEELEGERDEAFEAAGSNWDADETVRDDMDRETFAQEYWETTNPSEADELKALQALASEAEGYAPDWHHGATLIHRSYFVEYCEELCKDIGGLPRETPDYIVIDWEATAKNIEVDYTTVDFGDQEYLVR